MACTALGCCNEPSIVDVTTWRATAVVSNSGYTIELECSCRDIDNVESFECVNHGCADEVDGSAGAGVARIVKVRGRQSG